MIGGKEKYITTDSRNFILGTKFTQLDKKTGERKEYINGEDYYGTVKGLFDGIFELKLKGVEAKSIAELHNAIIETKNYIMGYVDEHKDELTVTFTKDYE